MEINDRVVIGPTEYDNEETSRLFEGRLGTVRDINQSLLDSNQILYLVELDDRSEDEDLGNPLWPFYLHELSKIVKH